MSDEPESGRGVAVSMPMGAIAAIVVVGLAAAGYTLLNREGQRGLPSMPNMPSMPTMPSMASKPGGARKNSNMRRKVGLTAVIALLENDTTRKVVIAILKAMAKRS